MKPTGIGTVLAVLALAACSLGTPGGAKPGGKTPGPAKVASSKPGAAASTAAKPGAKPGESPGATGQPSGSPGGAPGAKPGTLPSMPPGTLPSMPPGGEPSPAAAGATRLTFGALAGANVTSTPIEGSAPTVKASYTPATGTGPGAFDRLDVEVRVGLFTPSNRGIVFTLWCRKPAAGTAWNVVPPRVVDCAGPEAHGHLDQLEASSFSAWKMTGGTITMTSLAGAQATLTFAGVTFAPADESAKEAKGTFALDGTLAIAELNGL